MDIYMPKISIIVPVYGVEKYLRQCIDSILAQTLKEIEVILVDDGSPDGCPAIVDEYSVRDPRVVAVHQKNAGPGPARNKGIGMAGGEFVAFMDPDDLYPSNETLEHLYEAAISSGCDIVGGKLRLFRDGDDPKFGWELPIHTNFPRYGIVEYADFQSPYAYICYIFRRSFLVDNRLQFPPLRRFQDPVFFVKAMVAAGRFWAIDEAVYFYRTECRQIDWFTNGTQKLHDHISGCIQVLKIANANHLERLAGIVADDVLGLLKSLKVQPEHLSHDIVAELKDEIMCMFRNGKRYHRLQRVLGFGLRGFIERLKYFWDKKRI